MTRELVTIVKSLGLTVLVLLGLVGVLVVAMMLSAHVSGPVAGVGLIAAGCGVYFLPAFIAYRREHRHTAAITALTLCLGWTFVGWVVALVWALRAPDPAPGPPPPRSKT